MQTADEVKSERIAKRISRAGVCSRRKAEVMITEGRVKVDGNIIDTPATLVTEASDIRIDGKPLPKNEPSRVWMLHKPHSVITTDNDPEGRTTVFDILPKDMPRVMTVGRLDLNSEGLLLLTNDGEIARHMELPATGWTRRYRVRTNGTPTAETLRQLKKGMVVDGVHYGSVSAQIDREQGSNCWLTVSLTEGKNREIRVLFN
ncbi:MAG: pseudouridine synthase, partial [Rickettsiales bacterium]